MDISKYKKLGPLDNKNEVFLVENTEDKNYYVLKTKSIYNKSIYECLAEFPIEGTAKIIEIEEKDNELIVVEEYIKGNTLQDLIDSHKKFSRQEIIDYVLQISNVIFCFSKLPKKIIHRDIKPSNVIITKDKKAVLIDFNASKFDSQDDSKNQDTTLLGTHGYAAPEQYGFGKSSVKTDIYGIGALLKSLLCNIDSDENHKDLDLIIKRCIELDPKNRYDSIDLLMKDLSKASGKKLKFYKYLLPGFRTLNIWHILLSIPYYLLNFYISFTLDTEGGSFLLITVNRILYFLGFMSITLVTFNYLNILSIFPLCKSNNVISRILGIIILDIFLFVFWLIVFVVIAQFIS